MMTSIELEDESIAVERTPVDGVALTIAETKHGSRSGRTTSATMTRDQATRLAALLMCAATGGLDLVGWLRTLEIVASRRGTPVKR